MPGLSSSIAVLCVLAFPAWAPAAQRAQPIGVVASVLARFDRDDLRPFGPSLSVREPHTAPALSRDGVHLALGLSESGPPGDTGGRIGLWIVDVRRMEVVHAIRTGIAAEAVAYPGVVAALLQNGDLVVVDPATGSVLRRRTIGYSSCAPPAVEVAGHGVFVNEVRPNGIAELAVVASDGQVTRKTLRLNIRPSGRRCQFAPLVADPAAGRVLVVGRSEVAAVDVLTGRVEYRPLGDSAGRRTAALTAGHLLAVAGERGLQVRDTRSWKRRWGDRRARAVVASGETVIAIGRGVTARRARDGRARWRVGGRYVSVVAAADRAYLNARNALRIVDLTTGRIRGRHAPLQTPLRLASPEDTGGRGSPSVSRNR